jgi:hypothetical protein
MARPDTLILGGHAYSWQQLCELRRTQLAAWQSCQPKQLALFELKDDHRPAADRSAAGRFIEPSLLDRL